MPVNVALPLRVMVLPTVVREIVENEAKSQAVSALPSAPVPTVGEAVPALVNKTPVILASSHPVTRAAWTWVTARPTAAITGAMRVDLVFMVF